METEVISFTTPSTATVVDITGEVMRFAARFDDGLLSVFAPHATAGLALIETGAGSDSDLLAALDDVLPRDDRWRHSHGSPGHGADHVLPAFISPSLVIPVVAGKPTFGTWQSVVLVDPNRDNPNRKVRLSFVAG